MKTHAKISPKGEINEIVGKKFGKLTVIKKSNKGWASWLCKCDCGKEKIFSTKRLIGGKRTSCGHSKGKTSLIHGLSRTHFYNKWTLIQSRCYYKNNYSYKSYGGRGIKCLWNSSEEFRKDMHESYKKHCKEFGEKNTTIDRIDNNGNYCKENCRWVDMKTQQRNRRDNHLITFNNQTKCLAEWAEITEINYDTIHSRLIRGWTIERTLTIKVI